MKDMDNIQYNYKDGQLYAMTMYKVPIEKQPAWWRATVKFVASIKDVPWFVPQGNPDPTWRVFDTGDAARTAARDAARAAARAAARDAAWDAVEDAALDAALDAARAAARAAARDAARAAARDAARDAALAAARNAAGDAAWDAVEDAALDAARAAARAAAGDAAGDAARGAALMACIHITADLDVDEKHRAHARARWDVWCRGYGLAYDVSDVLYVYKRTV